MRERNLQWLYKEGPWYNGGGSLARGGVGWYLTNGEWKHKDFISRVSYEKNNHEYMDVLRTIVCVELLFFGNLRP